MQLRALARRCLVGIGSHELPRLRFQRLFCFFLLLTAAGPRYLFWGHSYLLRHLRARLRGQIVQLDPGRKLDRGRLLGESRGANAERREERQRQLDAHTEPMQKGTQGITSA